MYLFSHAAKWTFLPVVNHSPFNSKHLEKDVVIISVLRLKNLYTNPKIVLVRVGKRLVSEWLSCNPRSYWIFEHSGTLPHKYEVVILEPSVKWCYRSGNLFVDKYRRSPYNLVVKHVDRRLTGKNDITGQLIFSRNFSNTYYHLAKPHPTQKSHVLGNWLRFCGPIPFRSRWGTTCLATILWLTASGSVEVTTVWVENNWRYPLLTLLCLSKCIYVW